MWNIKGKRDIMDGESDELVVAKMAATGCQVNSKMTYKALVEKVERLQNIRKDTLNKRNPSGAYAEQRQSNMILLCH